MPTPVGVKTNLPTFFKAKTSKGLCDIENKRLEPVQSSAPSLRVWKAKPQDIQKMSDGKEFIFHGRFGRKYTRLLRISAKGERLIWKGQKKNILKEIHISEILEVVCGKPYECNGKSDLRGLTFIIKFEV